MTPPQKRPLGGEGPTTNHLLRAALLYARKGIRVLPLEPEGKAPIGSFVPNGLHDATTEIDTIRSWWKREPRANIGVMAPEGAVIVDIDPRAGGVETIKTLVNGNKLGSLVAKTGGADKGQHIWLKDAPQHLPGKLGAGVDLKAGGKGYVVAPPSIHPDTGRAYAWKDKFDLDVMVSWPSYLKAPDSRTPSAHEGTSDLTRGQVDDLLSRISAVDYDDWREVGMALKAGFGDKAFKTWVKWSKTAPEHADIVTFRKKWKSFKGSGISTGTLVAKAGLKHPPPIPAVDEFDAVEDDDDLIGLLPKPKVLKPLDLVRLNAVSAKPVPWAWPGYLAHGTMHCIAGEPSAGKSTFVSGLVSRMTQGVAWPDGTQMDEPLDVLLVNGEESLQSTVVPRLINCGADLGRITLVREQDKPFSLMDDIERTRQVLLKHPEIKVLVVDPIGSYMHGSKQKNMDSWKDDHVRGVLHPWARITEEFNLIFIFVAHFGKSKGSKGMHRVMGSQAFTAITRITHVCTTAAEYAGDSEAKAIGAVKQNLGRMRPPLLYYIRPVEDDYDAAPTVEFGAPVQGIASLDDLMLFEDTSKKVHEDDQSLPARIVREVERGEGRSMNAIAEAIGVQGTSGGTQSAMHRLIDSGVLVGVKGPRKALLLYTPSTVDIMG